MSHLTTAKSKIKNLQLLQKVLNELQINFTENIEGNNVTIKLWNNETVVRNDIVMTLNTGSPYNIGIIQNKETEELEFVADWWGVETYTQMNEETFMNKIQQKYAYEMVIEKVQAQGYSHIEEEIDENNNIRLVVRKWGN